MRLFIENETDCEDYEIEEKRPMLESLALETLATEGFSTEAEISLALVDNKRIWELNKKFRKIDRATDVLSFPLVTDFEQAKKQEDIILGDIIISIEKVNEQAESYGHSFDRELGFLFVHSLLHLLGYDHGTAEEEKEMFAKQEEILKRQGIVR